MECQPKLFIKDVQYIVVHYTTISFLSTLLIENSSFESSNMKEGLKCLDRWRENHERSFFLSLSQFHFNQLCSNDCTIQNARESMKK